MTNYIHINETSKEFHLTNGKLSYIFRVMEQTKILEQLYAGKAIRHQESFAHLIEREIRPSNNQVTGDHTTSLEHIKQEMPVYGTTDFRYPGMEIRYPDGDRIIEMAMIPTITTDKFFCTHGRLPKKYPASVNETTQDAAPIRLKNVKRE